MTDKYRPTLPYHQLTIAQAEQVAHDYPHHTDPHAYAYEVDPKTGKVTDRYKLTQPQQVTA
jgi:hypothetical protein